MSRPIALAAAAAAIVAGAAGCGGGGNKGLTKTATTARAGTTASPGTTPTAAGAAGSPASCRSVPAPRRRSDEKLHAPKSRLGSGTWQVNVATNCGKFTITLDVKRAPKTTASFASLIRLGFYDGLTFHRIVPGDLIQGGDPHGDGSGGPGYHITEPPPSDLKYTRSVVAMAKTEIEDPGTAGSQFFIVTGPDAQLDPDYALVGRVTAGMDTVDRIAVVPTDPNTDAPRSPVLIESMRVAKAGR